MRKLLRNILTASSIALATLVAASLVYSQVIPSGSTSQRRPVPRYFPTQQTAYVRTTLTFNMCRQTANVCTVQLANASLPYNAVVLRVSMVTYVAFNSTTSDTLSVGTTAANANEIVTTAMNLQSAANTIVTGTVVLTSPGSLGNTVAQSGSNGGLDLWAKWTAGTGNTATAGLATLIIEYIEPNDGNCLPVPLGSTAAGC